VLFARGFPRATFGSMIPQQNWSRFAIAGFLFCWAFFLSLESSLARSPARSPVKALRATPVAKGDRHDDSLSLTPPADLALRIEGDRKAQALAQFVEGQRLEEEGEIDEALEAYIKVLNVDPGEVDLA